MEAVEQKKAAKDFAKKWAGKGDEKQDTQNFWLSLLQDVYGAEHPTEIALFEKRVAKGFIDVYLPETRVLIEQKSLKFSLDEKEPRQGKMVTPYEQARDYVSQLGMDEKPRYIITCNFEEFRIYDTKIASSYNQRKDEWYAPYDTVLLSELETDYYRMNFLVNVEDKILKKEMEVSLEAGKIVGVLYNELLKQYDTPDDPETLKSLNKLCVRLVFCLYAEDAELFGKKHNVFKDYVEHHKHDARTALIKLFRVLNMTEDERKADKDLKYEEDELLAFPYVNGGLFKDDIEIPKLTDNFLTLLQNAFDFDWNDISPTIFGAVFEGTMNPETRRSGGMHYTSIENIHKVIDPLFLNDLKEELNKALNEPVAVTKKKKLTAFQEKIAGLKFLDPACGSGNFLTESYLALRRLENRTIRELIDIQKGQVKGQISLYGTANPIQVSIGQFYGIEINDFAVTVAQTALWIAEAQMMQETEAILAMHLDFLPLKSYSHIREANALRIDWNDVVPAGELNYIMGNPPFVGLSLRSVSQQEDMDLIFTGNDRAGRLDYVAAWYRKASEFINNTTTEVAFVSTNSICQGEQVPILWDDLFNKFQIKINYAYRSFIWESEAKEKAAVHCVIIGFARKERSRKILYESGQPKPVDRINGYLVNADNVFIQLRGKAQNGLPKLVQGNKPWDGGFLILSEEERDEIIKKYPQTSEFIKKYIGSYEFINNRVRYCLWLKDTSPDQYRTIPEIRERLEGVAETRRKTKTVAVQAQADTPMLFSQIRQPKTDYILIPETSSSNRRYIPMGFMSSDVIASNSTLVATDATLYLFGVLTSSVHMSWMRTVCGRLKSDYRYSPSIYNNFPWPSSTGTQKEKIEKTAQAILDARALYPDSSLAALYDPLTMPPELLKAHQANDKAVMDAYGFKPGTSAYTSEAVCVAELMKMYQKLTVNHK